MSEIKYGKNLKDEVTPENLYLNRRNFIRAGIAAGSIALTTGVYRFFDLSVRPEPATTEVVPVYSPIVGPDGETANSLEEISHYNNFYEFSTSKLAVASKARDFQTRPWRISVGGLVARPMEFEVDTLAEFRPEERIYRFRCVEGWSMVIPWSGFPLSRLMEKVEPLETAKYVAFETFYDPRQMQSSFSAGIDFPYVEGLRLDEALHPLTILATGIYGRPLPNQNGAPVRLVVPWKYGFKSIKSIVKITLTSDEPPTTWNIANADEYGFYSNVNPEVDHPRWSQKSERRIGEITMRKTLPFNGYGDEVGGLYSGMDLKKYF
ncbi:MAG: protein-methionine-sulfoxide reductase catalytic subunit MsrP [Acidobacteriota bacterium]